MSDGSHPVPLERTFDGPGSSGDRASGFYPDSRGFESCSGRRVGVEPARSLRAESFTRLRS